MGDYLQVDFNISTEINGKDGIFTVRVTCDFSKRHQIVDVVSWGSDKIKTVKFFLLFCASKVNSCSASSVFNRMAVSVSVNSLGKQHFSQ